MSYYLVYVIKYGEMSPEFITQNESFAKKWCQEHNDKTEKDNEKKILLEEEWDRLSEEWGNAIPEHLTQELFERESELLPYNTATASYKEIELKNL